MMPGNQKLQERRDSRNLTEFFKGIAIFMVILAHSQHYFSLSNTQSALQRFGQMGCQIFFVLSAFGLCHSFSKEKNWFDHMKNRVSKLAVGYWTAILIHVVYRVLGAVVSKESIPEAINIPGVILNALFLHGFIPDGQINNAVVRGGWYVGTTMILYALFPLLFKREKGSLEKVPLRAVPWDHLHSFCGGGDDRGTDTSDLPLYQ